MTTSSSQLAPDDVDAFADGCDLLGSGGGGSTGAARLVLRHHLRAPLPVASSLPGEAVVACVGAMGSAAVMMEDLPSPEPFVAAVRALEEHHGAIQAIVPFEIGGVNGVLAALAANALGVPLIDADSTGRAFTLIHRTVLAAKLDLTEVAFAGTSGEVALLRGDGAAIERMVRSMLPSVGGWGAIALHAGPAQRILPAAVSGSVSRALTLGRALMQASAMRLHDDGAMRTLFDGVVVEVRRRPGVYSGGVVTVQHRRNRRRVGRVDFANEYIAAYDNGVAVATAPDIVCILDHATWRPIASDAIAAHQGVRVVTFAAPPALRAAHDDGFDFGLAAHGLIAVEAAP